MLRALTKDLDLPGGIAALVLHYDVAPWAAYPRQLAQASSLLNHVLHNLRVPASRILVGGKKKKKKQTSNIELKKKRTKES